MDKSSAKSRLANTEARNRELLECGAFITTPDPEPAEPKDVVREKACREYANRSVEQAEQAREQNCGLTGPRWQTGFQRHFSWCMSVSDAYPAQEISQRRAALQNCRPQQSLDEGCEQYARGAFRLARQNQERRCGFVGPRWVRDIDAHKDWCLGANLTERQREQSSRHRALAACSGGPREIGACARYAQAAVKHAIQGQQRQCGFAGTRWQPDYEQQFVWCMSATPPQRFKERSYRRRALLKCGRNNLAAPRGNESQFLYRYRWASPLGSPDNWTSGWIKTGSRARCEHKVTGCRCGWQNYCNNYRNGEFALWWPNGCDRQPLRIVCQVSKR